MAIRRQWTILTVLLQCLVGRLVVNGVPLPEGDDSALGGKQLSVMAPSLPDEIPPIEAIPDMNGDQAEPENPPNPLPVALNNGGVAMAPGYNVPLPATGDQMLPSNIPNAPTGAENNGGIGMAPLSEIPVPDNYDPMFPANMPNPPPGAVNDGGIGMAPADQMVPVAASNPIPGAGNAGDQAVAPVQNGPVPDNGQMFPANMPNPPPGAVNDGGIGMAPAYLQPAPEIVNQMVPAAASNPVSGAVAPVQNVPVPDNNGQMFPANMPSPPVGAVNDGGAGQMPPITKPVGPPQGMFPPNMPPPPPGAFNDAPPSLPISQPKSTTLQQIPGAPNPYVPAVAPDNAVPQPNTLGGNEVPTIPVAAGGRGDLPQQGQTNQPDTNQGPTNTNPDNTDGFTNQQSAVAEVGPDTSVSITNANPEGNQMIGNEEQDLNENFESPDYSSDAADEWDSESFDDSIWKYFNFQDSSESFDYDESDSSDEWEIDEDSESEDSSDFYKWIFGGNSDSSTWQEEEGEDSFDEEEERMRGGEGAQVPLIPNEGTKGGAVVFLDDEPQSGTKLVLYCIPAIILCLLIFLAWRNYGGRIKVVGIPTGASKQHEWRTDTKSKEQLEPMLIANEREDSY